MEVLNRLATDYFTIEIKMNAKTLVDYSIDVQCFDSAEIREELSLEQIEKKLKSTLLSNKVFR